VSLDDALKQRLEKAPVFDRECCRDVNNLRYAYDLNKDRDKCILRCKYCGAIHHRLYAEGGVIGLKL